jgi:uncharacterized protein (TIGR02118 family)
MPMIDKHWKPHGMKSWTVAEHKQEDSLDGKTPQYGVVATVWWDSVDDLKNALEKEAHVTTPDVKNYTDVDPVLWVGRVAKTG